MRITIIVLLATLPFSAFANVKTDENAGVCAAYLYGLGRSSGVAQALLMADNKNRAEQFAQNWIKSFQHMQENKTDMTATFILAHTSCEKVGIRPAAYK